MNISPKLILVFAITLSLFACSSDNNNNQQASALPENDLVEIRGVATKGPISGATIDVIEFDANDGSETANVLASTTTDVNGNWTVSIPAPSHTTALLIKSTGGTFIDESDPEPDPTRKRTIDFSGNSLYGALFPGFSTASINILTSALIEKSRTEANGSNFLNVLNNNRNISSSAIGFDPFTVAAANPLTPSQNASVDAIEYAMYLGGIANALNSAAIQLGVAVATYDIVDGFIRDLADGILNGLNQAGVVNVLVNSVSVPFPANLDLNASINRFRNNNYAAYAVTAVSNVVTVNATLMQTSGINNSPSAIDDNYATVQNAPIITGNVLSNDTDPDGDALFISAFTQSANGSVTSNGDGSFTFTPATGFTGNAIFSYSVDDNKGGLDTAQVVIAVTSAPTNGGGSNNPPTAEAGTAITVDEGGSVDLTGSGNDTDGNITGYQWTQIVGSSVTLANATAANTSFTAPAVTPGGSESLIFQLTVTDDDSDTGLDFVTVTVNSTQTVSSNAPIADAGIDQNVNEQTGVTLDAIGSSDNDGTIISYSWTQTGGLPLVTLVNADAQQASFVGPNILTDTTFTFFVIVTDNDGNSSTDSIDVTMIAELDVINDNPVAVTDNLITPQGISINSYDLTANDTDLNLDPVILIGVTQPSNGTVTNNGDGSITYIPDLAFNGVDSFTYSVIDGQGGNDTGNVNITVDPDSDGDSLLDSVETLLGLDPLDPDFDNDGYFDGHEMLINGTAAFLSTETPPGTVISAANTNNLISTDTTWTLVNSPYWVQDDVSVQGGATLTIEPGVVVKFNLNVDLFVNANANLDVQGNAPIPQNIRFTSVLDDSLNGDTGGVVGTPGVNNWTGISFQTNSAGSVRHASVRYAGNCFYINNSSPQLDNVEVGDCGGYGIYTYATSGSMTSYLHNITITDFDLNSQSTGYDGIYIRANSATTNTLDVDTLDLDETGGTGYRGLFIQANSSANIPGVVNNVTITDVPLHALYIQNNGSGTVNPTLSNISIPGPGPANGVGLYLDNTSTGVLSPVFDGTNSISNISSTQAAIQIFNSTPDFLDTGSWSINNAGYGMYLSNTDGQFNNIIMDNMSIAGIRLANASNPSVFSDVVLTNALTPYELVGQDLTSTIIGGYDFSDASVAKNYIRINGALLADTTLGSDPLSTGSSVWRVTSNLTIPAGVTMTVEDGAVLKFDNYVYFYIDGSLLVGDGDGAGPNAYFTSIHDDDVLTGGDSNGNGAATVPNTTNYWRSIQARANSLINIDNAIIRFNERGYYQYNVVQPTAVAITNTTFSDTLYHAMELYAGTGHDITWNLDNVTIDSTGIWSTGYHGINLDINNDATFTGTWNNVTINDVSGSGIYIDDASSDIVNPTISGLTIGDTGTVGTNYHGVQLIGDATTMPTFNNSAGINTISAGTYNLTIQGVSGSYANMTLSNAASASIYFSSTANPSFWDDNSILLSNVPTPYRLLVGLPPSVGTLGAPSTDLGYNISSSSFTQNYITSGGTLSNITYVNDPLNTGSSVYRVVSNIIVPAGSTMTVEDGAVLKFDNYVYFYIDGSLLVGDGDGAGPNAYFTSIHDDDVLTGGDSNGNGAATVPNTTNYWRSIQARANSLINIDNAIIRFNERGYYQYNVVQPTAVAITNTTFSGALYHAMELYAGTGHDITWNLDNVTIDNTGIWSTGYHGIFLDINNNGTFTGTWDNVTINDVSGSGIYIDDASSGTVDPTISGLTIGDTGTVGANYHGVQLTGDATTTPIFNNVAGINTISAGTYNLTLEGVGGSYSNLTLESASVAAIAFTDSANPLSWDDATIILDTPSPYQLLAGLPASVGTLGAPSTDLGYNIGSSTIAQDYVTIGSPSSILGGSLSDIILVADPLNTTSSVYRVLENITIPMGVTMTVEDGAVLKFDNYRYFYVDGSLVVGDGDGAGANAYFTSIHDDDVLAGGDTNGNGGATIPNTTNYWRRIQARANSVINIDNAIIRFNERGYYQYNVVQPTAVAITNTTFSNALYYAMELYAGTGHDITWNLDNVTIDSSGIWSTGYHGIFLDINNNATFTGTWNNVTINDVSGSGIYIDDASSGTVNPTISGLTIGDTGTVGNNYHGVQLIGDATTTPIFNNTSGSGNVISAGIYNLYLQGVSGSFSNLTLNGASTSALYFSDNANPNFWNNTTITLDDAPSPFTLIGMNLPAQYTGYQAGGTLFENYAIISGNLVSDVTLSPDPLGISSVWYVSADLTVGAGSILTVQANTVVKAVDGADIFVDGTLNVTATVGQEAVFTDIRDDSYNGDSNNDGITTTPGGNTNWQGIDFRVGSQGAVDNLIVDQAEIAISVNNAGDGGVLTFNNLLIDNATDGLYINQTSPTVPTSPTFNNLTITNASSQHLYLNADNTTEGALMQPTFSGALLIAGSGTDGLYCNNAGPNISVSGFTIDGSGNGVDMTGGCSITLQNNLIRNATTAGVYVRSTAAPIIRSNVIVNNGSGGANHGGIYVNSSATAYINNNLIRGNDSSYGAGIMIRDSSPVVQNNLIIENHAGDASLYGGSGIFVWNNSSPTIINNTLANNTSTNATGEGAGLHIEPTAAQTVTLVDNIIYGNLAGYPAAPVANDIYFAGASTLIEDYNVIGIDNIAVNGSNDLEGSNPLFIDGWYLIVDALNGGGLDSPAIDAGSVDASNTALGAGTEVLSATTTRTDGQNEQDVNILLDIGYHYPNGQVSGSNMVNTANSSVSPASYTEQPNPTGGIPVLITVTPRSASNQVLGAGLVIVPFASDSNNLSVVSDNGDGTYTLTYTIPSGTGSDEVSFSVNGVNISDTGTNVNTTEISWSQF